MKLLPLTILAMICQIAVYAADYNILNFGAVADGKTLNTQNIQAAIDKASGNGGGQVVVPAGRFLTGTIVLKSGVDLHLDENAVLLGSTDPYDYPFMKAVLVKNGSTDQRRGALIYSGHQANIKVSGKGTLDGQGRKLALAIDSLFYVGKLDTAYYNLRRKRPDRRPGDIAFVDCDNVSVTGIAIKDAAFWVSTYELCKNLRIDNVRVESDAYWNNDGMDIVDCRNVQITNCFVNSADDGICLKSENKGAMNDSIYIAHCTVRSSASAIKFGTASTGGFKNVTIKDIKVYDTFRSAIALESVDGGILENILVDGIDAKNTGNAIFIRLGHRNESGPVGSLRNVVIRNVKVQVPFGRPDSDYELRGPALSFFHNTFPSSITGIPGHYPENITLENIEITYPGRGNDGLAFLPTYRLKDVPEVESQYPEFSMFGELPAWGFYVRHVKGLVLKNISIKAEKPDYRPAYVFDDVDGLDLKALKIQEDDHGKQIILRIVENKNLQVDDHLVEVVE